LSTLSNENYFLDKTTYLKSLDSSLDELSAALLFIYE
jgi:hypothetical protein